MPISRKRRRALHMRDEVLPADEQIDPVILDEVVPARDGHIDPDSIMKLAEQIEADDLLNGSIIFNMAPIEQDESKDEGSRIQHEKEADLRHERARELHLHELLNHEELMDRGTIDQELLSVVDENGVEQDPLLVPRDPSLSPIDEVPLHFSDIDRVAMQFSTLDPDHRKRLLISMFSKIDSVEERKEIIASMCNSGLARKHRHTVASDIINSFRSREKKLVIGALISPVILQELRKLLKCYLAEWPRTASTSVIDRFDIPTFARMCAQLCPFLWSRSMAICGGYNGTQNLSSFSPSS
jgi:hypothetical protein